MAPLHERMPVILPTRAAERAWLSGGDPVLLRPLPDAWLRTLSRGCVSYSSLNIAVRSWPTRGPTARSSG